MFAIIDIETTGTSAKFGHITEVAIFVHDGTRIVDEFVSLVNPECPIPYFITRLTGISDDMVADAPRFCEIAKRIVEITDGVSFVAHNAAFDYGFIKEEFARLGYDYQRDTLCTVRLSRALLPGMHSYSLGKLCEVLRITNGSRHRAAGDALATVKLFELLLQKAVERNLDITKIFGSKGSRYNLAPHQKEILKGLPEKTGVYYFYDKDHNLLYIGKSRNIRDRVHSHFNNAQTKRATEMREKIHSVSYERTGSELIALLKESDEIKASKPLYNRAQRRALNAYGLYDITDGTGYLCFQIRKNTSKGVPVVSFNNMTEAREFLFRLTEQYELCQRLNGLYPGSGACFHYTIHQCKGACCGQEDDVSYNIRAGKALQSLEFLSPNLLIVDRGREEDEKTVVMIENGKYLGFGYINNESQCNYPAQLHDLLYPAADNREVRRIINDYIRRNKSLKVVKY